MKERMGKAMANVITDIRQWANTLPYWEQAALDKILARVHFSESDYDELLQYLLKDVMTRSDMSPTRKNCTLALLKLLDRDQESAAQALMNTAIDVVDGYLTEGTDACMFDEPAYKNIFNRDLNAFLKWEKLGKSEEDCPRFRNLLAVSKFAMGQKAGGQPSMRETIRTAIAC